MFLSLIDVICIIYTGERNTSLFRIHFRPFWGYGPIEDPLKYRIPKKIKKNHKNCDRRYHLKPLNFSKVWKKIHFVIWPLNRTQKVRGALKNIRRIRFILEIVINFFFLQFWLESYKKYSFHAQTSSDSKFR